MNELTGVEALNSKAKKTRKETWSKPALTRYGAIAKLTQAGGGRDLDGKASPPNRTFVGGESGT